MNQGDFVMFMPAGAAQAVKAVVTRVHSADSIDVRFQDGDAFNVRARTSQNEATGHWWAAL